MTSDTTPAKHVPEWKTLLISGILGALVGGIWYGSWQVVVESGQAVSGVVEYPVGNAFYQYHIKAWTIAHQITALLLIVGLSAKFVCILVSAVLGALVFMVLSGVVLLVAKNRGLALFTPFAILALLGVRENFYYGVAYPIVMFNSHHSNGIMGRNLSILIMILIGLGYRRAAFILLGLIPALHITWGAWTWGVVACWLVWEGHLNRKTLVMWLPWFGLGFGTTILSFVITQWMAQSLPVVDAETQTNILTTFYTYWDYHRAPVSINMSSYYMAVMTFALSAAWYTCFKKSLCHGVAAFLRLLMVTSGFSCVACVVATVPHILPNALNMLMLGRFVNSSIAVLPVLALALVASEVKRSRLMQVLLFQFFLYVAFNYFFMVYLSSDRFGWRLPHAVEFLGLSIVLVGYALANRNRDPEAAGILEMFPGARPVMGTITLLVVVLTLSAAWHDIRSGKPLLTRETPASIAAAQEGQGILITPGTIQVLQLRTNRPLLINGGGLDQIAFIPASGVETARVLDRVYGIDFYNPPDDIKVRRPGTLLPDSGKETWESRTAKGWSEIANEFGTTQLLAPTGWTIDLKAVASDDQFTLYDLPEPEGEKV